MLLCSCGATAPQPAECSAFTFDRTPGGANNHVACTDACGNSANPPTGGPHCGSLLSCRLYDNEQGRCVWLHNLEHGHAVLLYNCPEGCPEVTSQLEALREQAPRGSNGVPRALVVADLAMPQRVAAVVWGASWSGDAVNEDAIRCLLRLQDGEAPEANLACAP